jgi:putative Mg2+ transporter-C (MgtC) family protein
MITVIDAAGRLAAAMILGAVIGYERQGRMKFAGFRTHILVSLGACLTMMVSLAVSFDLFTMYKFTDADPERIAAQVISGIGFLGAGAIIKDGFNVSGLTTAASLWVVAAIGLTVGGGYYTFAVIATILAFLTLTWFSKIEKSFINAHDITLAITTVDNPEQMGRIVSYFGNQNLSIKDIHVKERTGNRLVLSVTLISARGTISKIIDRLFSVEGVEGVSQED